MIFDVFQVGPMGANCVLLADEESRAAVVIDPGGDAPVILTRLGEAKLELGAIVHTHGHIDHIAAAGELQRATGAPVYLHEADRRFFENGAAQAMMFGLPAPAPCSIDHPLEHQGTVPFGAHCLSVRHTPGHSPGSVSFIIDDVCLCGDTLFAGGVGRTDLMGGSFDTLARSIREQLYTLPPATRVIPGHGPATTIESERLANPFVRA